MNATDFGLIGHPLGHSLSPFIHKALLAAAGLPGDYRLFDLAPEELPAALPRLLRDLDGFNCTIPHKEAVLPYLSDLDGPAARIRAVNTVWRGIGYNTDYRAFQHECPLTGESQVLLLGAGGVSRTMAFAAAAAGAVIHIVARRPEQARALAESVICHYPGSSVHCPASVAEWLGGLDGLDEEPAATGNGRCEQARWTLLNGTPLGLWPAVAGMPFPVEALSHIGRVFDTIYNPVATRLVLAARSRGIPAAGGLGMLFSQALAAERIWHPGHEFPAAAMDGIKSRLARAILHQSPTTLILTGFMGCGKTTVGTALARLLDLPFVDLDQAIEAETGRSIPAIFAEAGEPAFRRIEQEQLGRQLQAGRSQVLASGGGTLMDPAAESLIRAASALVIFLDTSLEQIRLRVGDGQGRPMIYRQDDRRLDDLFGNRQPRYRDIADLIVGTVGDPARIAARVAADLGFGGQNHDSCIETGNNPEQGR